MDELTPTLTVDQARVLVEGCKNQWELFERSMDLIIKHQVWTTLGYNSFNEMYTKEGLSEFRLSPMVRDNVISLIRRERPGISNRETANIVGVSEKTVRNHIKMGAENSAFVAKATTSKNKSSKIDETKNEVEGQKSATNVAVVEPSSENVVEGEIITPQTVMRHCPSCRCEPS